MLDLAPPPTTLDRGTWPPDYVSVFEWRINELAWYAEKPENVYKAKHYYADHPIDFINHWVDTFDPRNAFDGQLPTRLPLIMFRKQDELVTFLLECLSDQQNGLIDKSRDMGATWICCAFSVWLWLFKEGSAIGWGSRKEELVDKLGDPKSVFEKLRQTIDGLPLCFLPKGFVRDKHMTYMKIINPENSASIVGEAGDNIGRGGRTLIYFKDESAHYEHPESIEAALGDNTNVQMDLSTVHGVGTVFDRKRQAGMVWMPGIPSEERTKGVTRVFVMDWQDHPMKTQEWHDTREKKAKDEGLLHIFRQEVDRDAAASIQGVIIPSEWVRYLVDAHIVLGLDDAEEGPYIGALDVADEGGDMNALTFRKGIVLNYADDWGDGDTGVTTRKTTAEAAVRQPITIHYDCIGVGAGIKAEANRLKTEVDPATGKVLMPKGITFMDWNAGGKVLRPEERVIKSDPQSPLNKDFYTNVKAQAWWALRRRAEKTYRMIKEGIKYPTHELMSLSSKIPKIEQVKRELSQPVMIYRPGSLKMIVDKKPEGSKSPNLADSVVMNYFPIKMPVIITAEVMRASMVRR